MPSAPSNCPLLARGWLGPDRHEASQARGGESRRRQSATSLAGAVHAIVRTVIIAEEDSRWLKSAPWIWSRRIRNISSIHCITPPITSPPMWVKGEGIYLWDAEGRQYIDGLACLWNVNIGHGRQELASGGGTDGRAGVLLVYAVRDQYPSHEVGRQAGVVGLPQPQHRLFHQRWSGIQRECLQDRALLLEGQRQTGQGQSHCAPAWLPWGDASGHERHWDGSTGRCSSPGCLISYMCRRRTPIGLKVSNRVRPLVRRRPAIRGKFSRKPDTVAAFIAEPAQGAGGVLVPRRLFPQHPPRLRQI